MIDLEIEFMITGADKEEVVRNAKAKAEKYGANEYTLNIFAEEQRNLGMTRTGQLTARVVMYVHDYKY